MRRLFTLEYWRDGDWYVGRLMEVPGVLSQGESLRVLGELHRDLSYLMMGKGVSVAGADREEAPGPKPEPTGREPGSPA